MDTKQLQKNSERQSASIFHPSGFETPSSHVPMEERTLMTVRKERGQRLTGDKVEELISPGAFKFTVDDKQMSKSNTRHLFRNL